MALDRVAHRLAGAAANRNASKWRSRGRARTARAPPASSAAARPRPSSFAAAAAGQRQRGAAGEQLLAGDLHRPTYTSPERTVPAPSAPRGATYDRAVRLIMRDRRSDSVLATAGLTFLTYGIAQAIENGSCGIDKYGTLARPTVPRRISGPMIVLMVLGIVRGDRRRAIAGSLLRFIFVIIVAVLRRRGARRRRPPRDRHAAGLRDHRSPSLAPMSVHVPLAGRRSGARVARRSTRARWPRPSARRRRRSRRHRADVHRPGAAVEARTHAAETRRRSPRACGSSTSSRSPGCSTRRRTPNSASGSWRSSRHARTRDLRRARRDARRRLRRLRSVTRELGPDDRTWRFRLWRGGNAPARRRQPHADQQLRAGRGGARARARR